MVKRKLSNIVTQPTTCMCSTGYAAVTVIYSLASNYWYPQNSSYCSPITTHPPHLHLTPTALPSLPPFKSSLLRCSPFSGHFSLISYALSNVRCALTLPTLHTEYDWNQTLPSVGRGAGKPENMNLVPSPPHTHTIGASDTLDDSYLTVSVNILIILTNYRICTVMFCHAQAASLIFWVSHNIDDTMNKMAKGDKHWEFCTNHANQRQNFRRCF